MHKEETQAREHLKMKTVTNVFEQRDLLINSIK